ncbi:ABC transporter ATP-binding protein [Spongiactinospora sp. TRM90649]|uniref:ABC transporter ATP-binding protein n=1 Tax=Spongiactinospora sp. TRM90649 TaxID=3031114 RepID=UPI0023F779D4|nr:ABC transporter ATP-binding protein [Spongiactinospora sp. TRM90649]MDF5753382.1 ABC transporter ATP-binding protein [Spongiactinospora sp. TRM90649]
MRERTRGVPVELRGITKIFAGAGGPAVRDLHLSVAPGETAVLLGPSGCGKTTTLRMINRLVEPTRGDVLIGGRGARDIDPDRLRRGIGYVVRRTGLFPHMTVAANIAQVPRLLGWDARRIAQRVDELLALVGLEPAAFRDRYPRLLSGGQRRRVGVARALAADPPLLLMDDPFGALGPADRRRLQDELLRLQRERSRTIVFATSDVDEALRLGDRIAVMRRESRIVRYAPPSEILADPVDEYVERFLGGSAPMRRLTYTRVGDIDLDQVPHGTPDTDAGRLLREVEADGRGYALLLDAERRPCRWVTADALRACAGAPVGEAPGDPGVTVISGGTTLQEAVEALLGTSDEVVPVVGGRQVYAGVVSLGSVQRAIRTGGAGGWTAGGWTAGG